MIQASLIIALQNNIRFADLALVSIERQTMRDFEIILVADNASSDLVRTVQTRLPLLNIPARVAWSQDNNLNTTKEQQLISTALRTAQSDYLIFTDSNTILHREFVREHCNNRKSGTIITGRRVELSGGLSSSLTTEEIREGWLEYKYWRVLSDGIFGQSTNVLRGFHFRSKLVRLLLTSATSDAFGGNFSIHKSDAEHLIQSLESSKELSVRAFAKSLGVTIRLLRNTLIQYHCNESTQAPLQLVPGVLERVKRLRYTVPEFGLQPAMFKVKRQGRRG